MPDPRTLSFLGDFAWLRRVRRQTLVHYAEEEDTSLDGCSEKVRQLINQYVKTERVAVLLKPVSILSDQFSMEVDKLESARAKASYIEHAMSRTITFKVQEDPVFYESLQERLERIIQERRQGRIDDVKEFQLLLNLHEDLRRGQGQNAESLGLNEDSYAVYGLLRQHLLASQDKDNETDRRLTDLAESLFETLQREAVIDWISKEDTQREMRRKIKRELRLADCPSDKIEELTTAIMDLARVRLAK
ncbi:MAG: type I restriction enzyme endonuclease domain-containing protein [Candidatus Binatia bacterium]